MTLTRRHFNAALAGGAAASVSGLARPNILWITCEDTGPQLGAYGDRYAVTPNLDRLAARGLRYLYAWSNAPVCAPARTSIISGLLPPSTGAEHMRSLTSLPPGMLMYPCYLRQAGYYASNNVKEDYNLAHTGTVWDDSSRTAHWRNRKPGQPFFSVFNFTVTHESQIRRRPHTLVHDPARVRVPAYHPDTPEVRRDWAQYYDNITTMDGQAGQLLRDLERDGLAEDTIVFFYGDHGPGLPRCKRYPYNSGLQVPLIVHVPEKFLRLAPPDYRAGGASGRLVSFVDLAPTVLSLAGIRPPAHMQGRAFLGAHIAPPPRYNYGFRGRMDERYDLMRSLRDQRYVYIRNYMPHRIYGQHVGTMFQMPTTQAWKRLYDEGKLNAATRRFWETKPPEELYDLQTDPDEVNNLAGSAAHRPVLERMRKAQRELALEIRDVGFLPEGEIHSRSLGATPYQMGHDGRHYPLERVLRAAEGELPGALEDPDSAVRYWGATHILARGAAAVSAARPRLLKALADSSPYVRAVAADALARHGQPGDLDRALAVLAALVPADNNGAYVSLWALDTIDNLGPKAQPIAAAVKSAPVEDPAAPQRARGYPARIQKHLP